MNPVVDVISGLERRMNEVRSSRGPKMATLVRERYVDRTCSVHKVFDLVVPLAARGREVRRVLVVVKDDVTVWPMPQPAWEVGQLPPLARRRGDDVDGALADLGYRVDENGASE